MSWLTPGIAGLVAAIAVPTLLILYFLKLRRREVEVSTTLLWRKAIQDLQANAPFQKLRRNILLLLQLFALAAAIAALAQPFIDTTGEERSRHIILIDRSASMNATDGDEDGATRLDVAKRRAIELVEGLREPGLFSADGGDEAMVIVFGETAQVLQTFTADKAAAIRAIESVTPTDMPSTLGEAFRLAKAHAPTRKRTDDRTGAVIDTGLVAGPPAVLHLYTDGGLPDAPDVLPGVEDRVVFHAVGGEQAANVGITALRAERDYEDPDRLTVFVGVAGTRAEPTPAEVELLIDGTPSAIRGITLPASVAEPGQTEAAMGTGGTTFEFEYPEAAVITARVRTTVGDVLPADNEAYTAVAPARRARVALVTGGALFLQRALESLPIAGYDVLVPSEYEGLSASERARYDVVVAHNWVPSGEALPEGRWLLLGGMPPGVATPVAEPEPAVAIDWSRTHPVLRDVVLDGLTIGSLAAFDDLDPRSMTVLAETSVGPGIMEYSGGGPRAIVVGFDPAESTWPFDVGFVIFLGASVDYLAAGGTGAEGWSRDFTTGGLLVDAIPTGVGRARVEGPSDEIREELTVTADGRVVFGELERAGVYTVSWDGPTGIADARVGGRTARRYAVSVANANETDVRRPAAIEFASRTAEAEETATETRRELWRWAVLLVLAVLIGEWYVFNRKVAV